MRSTVTQSEALDANPEGSGRRFARFAEGRASADGYWPLPPDGLCLSSFVLLSPADGPDRVLVGRMDPSAPWAEIGALDPVRVQAHSAGWMLPSCHLRWFESPAGAARRVLIEQLGLERVDLSAPEIYSESYAPRRHPDRGTHWDLEFLFRGRAPDGWVPAHRAWKRLEFVRPATTPRVEFARAHDEVLELAGFRIG
ncbi:MAG: hypothetical protein ACREBZ_07255 [Thermoplasmata archaeon]